MKLFRNTITLLPYKKGQILILDKVHSNYIYKCLNLLSTANSQIVHTRKEEICIFAFFSLEFYKVLLKTHEIKLAYFSGIFDFVKPKSAITFIDNNPLFYDLSLIFRKTKFYSIQNGNHLFCKDKKNRYIERYNHAYFNIKPKNFPVTYLSIGEYEKFFYSQNCNFKLKEIIPVGSLATACRFYSKKFNSIPLLPSYDLGIIGNSTFGSRIMGLDDNLMFSYIRELINLQGGLKICYISKFKDNSKQSKWERIYIDKFFNGKIKYLCSNDSKDSLDFCCECNILVGTISSILREAFSLGIKIISLNTFPYSSSLVYDQISFKKFPDISAFRKEINYLKNLSRKEYFEKYDFKLLDLNSYMGKTAIDNIGEIINLKK